jgi:hypothetical protein
MLIIAAINHNYKIKYLLKNVDNVNEGIGKTGRLQVQEILGHPGTDGFALFHDF